jgi:hypothetical protein
VAKVDRIWKLGLDADLRLFVLAELALPPAKYPAHSAAFMQSWTNELDALPLGSDAYRAKAAYWRERTRRCSTATACSSWRRAIA